MASFLQSLQNKAQQTLDKHGAVLDKTPLGKISQSMMTHTTMAQQQPEAQGSPTAGYRPGTPEGSRRGLLMENITHQLRALHNQYAPQGPPPVRHVQVLITNAKGVALDYQGIGRDTQAVSKDLYLWGQDQEEDVKDVTDRLAYINFLNGQQSGALASSLDAARTPFKSLRTALNQLAPRQAQRQGIEAQIGRLRAEGGRGGGVDVRIAELEADLRRRLSEDEPLEVEVAGLKRKAIKESENMKWKAMQEYAEKLLLLSQTSLHILNIAPTVPPSAANPYGAHEPIAQARATLQSALDNYQFGQVSQSGTGGVLNFQQPGVKPGDVRSFGESHRAELSRVPSMASLHTQQSYPTPHDPGSHGYGVAEAGAAAGAASLTGHPLDPSQLNNAPASIPHHPSSGAGYGTGSPASAHQVQDVPPSLPPRSPITSTGHLTADPVPLDPTVAETGVPISAGEGGPGPARGSLLAGRNPDQQQQGGGAAPPSDYVGGFRVEAPGGGGQAASGAPTYTSAEEEKKRLAANYGSGATGGAPVGPPLNQQQQPPHATDQSQPTAGQKYESADDEKKRLERLERDKLFGTTTDKGGPPGGAGDSAAPPSYE